MKFIAVLAAWFAALATPVLAQSIEFAASPVPIIDVTIGDRPARLEVIPDFPPNVVLNAEAARRLRVTTVPFPHAKFSLMDSNASVRMRLGVQRVSFGETRGLRVTVARNAVSEHADGIIGMAALPYRIITFNLRPDPEGATDIALPLATENSIFPRLDVGGVESVVAVDFRRTPTFFNRVLARQLDAAGHFTPSGELVPTHIVLGLSTMMQPVAANVTIAGLPVGTGAVRTDGPLLGLADPEDLVVEAEAPTNRRPFVALGREALQRCSSVKIDRVARVFTLRCALPAA